MTFRFRRRLSLGPFRFNITERGWSSTSIKAGPFTHNLTSRKTTTNLPDGAFYETSPRRRQPSTHRCRCGECGRFM